jgi:o-succinylbenzoate synthase
MDVPFPRSSDPITDASVETREIALLRPLRGPRGPVTVRTVRLLRLVGSDGTGGIGEASRVDWLTASPSQEDDTLLATLVERIRSDKPQASTLLRWSMDASRPAAVRSALQTALLDLEARRRDISVAALLGATPPGQALKLSALLGDDQASAMAREAAQLSALGITSFKMKVGRTDADVERVAAVRSAVGPAARLRLDANGAWDFEEATRAMDALAFCGAEFVEEPLREASRTPGLAAALPIALDESVRDAADLERALARGGFRVLVLKLERVGGPLPALAMADTAMRAGLEVVFTDSIESAVGRAATLHVAAAAAARGGVKPSAVGLGGLFLLDDGATSAEPAGASAGCELRACGPGLGDAAGDGTKPQ